MARIDPSRQGVMNERSFNEGDINFWPKNDEKVKKRLQTTKNPIPPSVHPYSSFKGLPIFPHWGPSLVSAHAGTMVSRNLLKKFELFAA